MSVCGVHTHTGYTEFGLWVRNYGQQQQPQKQQQTPVASWVTSCEVLGCSPCWKYSRSSRLLTPRIT